MEIAKDISFSEVYANEVCKAIYFFLQPFKNLSAVWVPGYLTYSSDFKTVFWNIRTQNVKSENPQFKAVRDKAIFSGYSELQHKYCIWMMEHRYSYA